MTTKQSSDTELMAQYDSLRNQACGEAIGEREQKPAEAVEAEIKCGIGQLIDEPSLRRRLDERAGLAQKKPDPENAIVAVAKRAERMAKKHRGIS